jgi:hypothetical protein
MQTVVSVCYTVLSLQGNLLFLYLVYLDIIHRPI